METENTQQIAKGEEIPEPKEEIKQVTKNPKRVEAGKRVLPHVKPNKKVY